jgi:hypothetical protein
MPAIQKLVLASGLSLFAVPTAAYAQDVAHSDPEPTAVDYGPPPSGGARDCELWLDPPLPIHVYFTDITFSTGTRHPDGSALYGGQGPGEGVFPLDPELVPPGRVGVTYRGGWDLSDKTATYTGTVHCSESPTPSAQRFRASSPDLPPAAGSPLAATSPSAPSAQPPPRSASAASPASIVPAPAASALPPTAPLSASTPRSLAATSWQLPVTGNPDWLFPAGFAGFAALAAGVALRLCAGFRRVTR